MYERLVGTRVKVVHRDGERSLVYEGLILSADNGFIEMSNERGKAKRVIIALSTIERLEVIDEKNESPDDTATTKSGSEFFDDKDIDKLEVDRGDE